ncbi:MAG TPA: heavy metal translocating P-type ATPase metal-binding domain-containing protein [Dongiaceae bacterium]|nr:heavy metal translocating P-type ATPase metal-binding domain-containing protein [Dongiaceae bacterium]
MNALRDIAVPTQTVCQHCGGAVSAGESYCCTGCRAAHQLVGELGLDQYYRQRQFDPAQRRPRPEADRQDSDLSAWIAAEESKPGSPRLARLTMMVDGLHCGACVWLIEQALMRQPGVTAARVSLTTRRLSLAWQIETTTAAHLVSIVESLGYRLVPVTADCLRHRDEAELKSLLRAMAVAGFAAGNLMLLSVSVWSGHGGDMAPGTRDLFHWISALIAIPAVGYAGRPFFKSAWNVLRHGRTNMDVPISLAIILAPSISLYETFTGGEQAYFDSAATLLFFLLIGRYLDLRARRLAHSSAEQLMALGGDAATVILKDGSLRDIPARDLKTGQRALVRTGARIPADGTVTQGESQLDISLISGESMPAMAKPGTKVFAGTLNLVAPLTIAIDKVGDATLLADIKRLMEAAESRRNRFVRIADRIARYYAPFVHVTALLTFLGWITLGHLPWTSALLIAIAVLIITCPCALALAVPVVQVVASHRLLQAGILLKSADALERLCQVDSIVLDKTGTLTIGRLELQPGYDPQALAVAARISANSKHPLARAVARAGGDMIPASPVTEIPGKGLEWDSGDGIWRLGSAAFTGQPDDRSSNQVLWLLSPIGKAAVFHLADPMRPDATAIIAELARIGPIEICSGDRPAPVAHLARQVGISTWHALQMPADKVRRLEELRAAGKHVLMIGDGLNDAPALRAAHVSMAPTSAADISQNAADLLFQGDALRPVTIALGIAKASERLMRQNLALAIVYNLAAIPLAICGQVTPLVAAISMSTSSILVVLNSLRLTAKRRETQAQRETRPAGGLLVSGSLPQREGL